MNFSSLKWSSERDWYPHDSSAGNLLYSEFHCRKWITILEDSKRELISLVLAIVDGERSCPIQGGHDIAAYALVQRHTLFRINNLFNMRGRSNTNTLYYLTKRAFRHFAFHLLTYHANQIEPDRSSIEKSKRSMGCTLGYFGRWKEKWNINKAVT